MNQRRISLSRKVEPFNVITASTVATNVSQYIQDTKIQQSKVAITKFQYQGRWGDEYSSWVGRIADSNLFKEPARFFSYMGQNPQLYRKSFFFRQPFGLGELLDATAYANRLIHEQAAKFGVKTGRYKSGFVLTTVKGGTRRLLTDVTQLEKAEKGTRVEIYNPVEYAGRVERNAIHYSRIGGVLYYAAMKTKRKFPTVAVRFKYHPASSIAGVAHYYNVPVLTLGAHGDVNEEIRRPPKRRRGGGRSRRTRLGN